MSNWNRHLVEFHEKRIVSNDEDKKLKVYLTPHAVRAFNDFNNARAYINNDCTRIKNLGRFKLHKKIKDEVLNGRHYILCDIRWIED